MFRIPTQDKRFSQPNSSDVNGNIFATKNINFDEEGYLKLSHGVAKISSSDSDFEQIDAMFKSNNGIYFLSNDTFRLLRAGFDSSLQNDTTSESAPTPGPENDGVYFNGTQVISDGTSIRRNNAGTWTAISGTSLPSNGGVAMEVFPRGTVLVVGKGNKIIQVNTSWTVTSDTVTLSTDYEVTSIATSGSTIYIATRHRGNGDARLFVWDGTGTAVDFSYSVGTFELSTIKNYQSSVAGVNALGQVVRFNGGGFDVLANFPVYYTGLDWGDSLNNNSFIANRGMSVDGDVIYFNVSTFTQFNKIPYITNMPGGLWCYDPRVGLYHKNSQTKNGFVLRTVSDTAVNISTDEITIGINVPTASAIFYPNNSLGIPELVSDTFYYAINMSSTVIKLAKTYTDAVNNVAINLSSVTASTSGTFYVITSNDWGDVWSDDRVSVLTLPNNLYETDAVDRIIFTNHIQNKAGADDYGITMSSYALEARGYFITPKLSATNIQDTYNTLTLRYRPLKNTDKIIVKYRTKERAGLPILQSRSSNITWTSTTTYTTNLEGYANAQIGDEVEIIGGQGAGFIAHISNIQLSGTTYTVTLNEACSLVANGDFAQATVNNWALIETIDTSYPQNWKSISVDQPSDWIQFKIELRGSEVTIQELIVDNRQHQASR